MIVDRFIGVQSSRGNANERSNDNVRKHDYEETEIYTNQSTSKSGRQLTSYIPAAKTSINSYLKPVIYIAALQKNVGRPATWHKR